jgi:tRNA(Ile)-lysidine synthase
VRRLERWPPADARPSSDSGVGGLPADPGAGGLVTDLLSRCRFPAGNEPLIAAVSGGADSLALLVLARAAGREVTAIHVDHGLRPGSAAEAEVVEAAAARFGAGFEARAVSLPPGPDLEARARQARYAALPIGVVTGHTADDLAETVLLNLIRGAAIDGLAGMRDGPRVRRPLLQLRRRETRQLCEAVGLDPVDDPSNRDPRFRRNRVRLELLPLLADISERDVVPVLARQAELIAADADLLDELAAGVDPTYARGLVAAPLALSRRALRRWLRDGEERHPPSSAEIERVLAVASGEAAACELAGGRRVWRSGGRLRVAAIDSDK